MERVLENLISTLAERCQQALADDQHAQAFLKSNGIGDERVWKRFRLGAGVDDLQLTTEQQATARALGLIGARGKHALGASGVIIPTYDPRAPLNAAGLLKICYAQNKYRLITPPSGVACTVDVSAADRLVLTDTPFLALRLAQHGVPVCIALDAQVFPPLKDWLRSKSVIVASYRHDSIGKISAALGEVDSITLSSDLWRSAPASLEKLGLSVAAVKPEQPPPAPITPALLKRLVEYGQSRVASGAANDALRSVGVDDPEFVRVFNLGFLPADFRSALSEADLHTLAGNRIGNSIIVPAYDFHGAVVDALCHYADGGRVVGLMSTMAGLIAPRVVTSFDEIIVTDSLQQCAQQFRSGRKNALFLRGVEDVQLNAQPLWDAGVRAVTLLVHRNADEFRRALEAVGIVVKHEKRRYEAKPATSLVLARVGSEQPSPVATAPAPAVAETPVAKVGAVAEPTVNTPVASSELVFVAHDEKAERATFRAGDATYVVDTDVSCGTKLEVRLERDNRIHIDRFDLAVDAQRSRFATSAAMRTQLPFESICAHTIAILDAVGALHDRQRNPAKAKPVVMMSDADRQAALAMLKRPDLLDAIAADMALLGWIGEDKTKRLLYLAAVSRKQPAPVWVVMRASPGAGKSMGTDTISELTPTEDLLQLSRLTGGALYYGAGLNHKVITIDEFDALTPEVIVALRVLHTRGALSQSHTERDAFGKTVTRFTEARGPVAVLTSTAGGVEGQLLSRMIEVSVDESAEQTRRIIQAQLQRQQDVEFVGANGTRAEIVRRHHNFQRLLDCRPVIIPYADRIQFPNSSVKHRRTLEKVIGLIQASALLHQHQRLKHRNKSGEQVVVADIRDFEIAVTLANEFVARSTDELSLNARDVLEALQAAKLTDFDVNDLKALKPDWSRHKLRSGIDELAAQEIVHSPRRTRPRRYTVNLAAAMASAVATLRLLPEPPNGDIATIGESGFTNTSPRAASG